jgi:bifunctional non-homologous end joining protein LigD
MPATPIGALFEQTKAQGYEGVIAKRRTSIYRCGERSPNWIKTEHWLEGEFVIGGWSPPRKDHGWGLLVGEPDERGTLAFRGRVELGITVADREELEAMLSVRRAVADPFAGVRGHPDNHYVEPDLTVGIRYLEVTSGGLLRHAVFRQLGASVGTGRFYSS